MKPPVVKETGAKVKTEFEKMSKSKYNGVDPQVCFYQVHSIMHIDVLKASNLRGNWYHLKLIWNFAKAVDRYLYVKQEYHLIMI